MLGDGKRSVGSHHGLLGHILVDEHAVRHIVIAIEVIVAPSPLEFTALDVSR